jgi:RHS repeat-associated protein
MYGNLRYRYLNHGNILQTGELRFEYDPVHPYAVSRDSDGKKYAYDTNSNMTRRGGDDLTYDALNRLVAISRDGAVTASFAYDHANNRIKKETSDGIVRYNADRLYEVAAFPGGERHTKYYFGIKNELVAQMSVENATLSAHYDPGVIGATYAWDNPKGIVFGSYRYLNYLARNPETYRRFAAAIMTLFTFGLIMLLVRGMLDRTVRKPAFPSWAEKTAPLLCVCVFGSFGILGCSNLLDHDQGGVPPWIMAVPQGGDGPEKPAPGMLFFHPDYNTNISYITDHRGEIVSKYHYKPYGEMALKTGSDPAYHKFNSHHLDDESGLYYYNARYYDPGIGRFITPDTIVPDPGNSQSLNRYMYVEGNPITLNDPSGNRPSWQIDLYAEQVMSNWKQQADRQPDNVLTQMCKSLLNSAFFGMISLIDGGGWSFLAHWITNFINFPEFNLSYSYKEGWGVTAGFTYYGCGGGSHWQQRGPNKGFSQWGAVSLSYQSFSIGLTTSFNFNKHTMTNNLRVSLRGKCGGVGLGYTWVHHLRGMKLISRGMTGYAGINISGIIGSIPTSTRTASAVNGEETTPDREMPIEQSRLTWFKDGKIVSITKAITGLNTDEPGVSFAEYQWYTRVLDGLITHSIAVLHDNLCVSRPNIDPENFGWMTLCIPASAIGFNDQFQRYDYHNWLRGY